MSPSFPCPPVLILAFNRPAIAARLFDALRPARPARIFFAVDGAREDRAGEAELVRRVQALADTVDWPCRIAPLFRERNLGCKVAVSGAISWFFEHVEEGLVLEDDCIPHPTYFPFAAELLARYRDDRRVMMVSGDCFQKPPFRTDYSYYFSRYTHTAGWATWRRAWALYDHRMSAWPELRRGGWLQDILGDRRAVRYWQRIFDATHDDHNTSWAYRFLFAAWSNGCVSIVPRANLMCNIGFGPGATHTNSVADPMAEMPVYEMELPLRHPPFMIRDAIADAISEDMLFSGKDRLPRRIARRIARGIGR
jgi:hypothetical protein